MANFVILSFYDYHFYAGGGAPEGTEAEYLPIPKWIWLVSAFNLFMAHTLGMYLFSRQNFALYELFHLIITL